jgi:hypothetical protein
MLRPGKDEPLSAYRERVEDDFKKRPKFYINDKSYYRNEFDLDSVKARAKKIAEDIRRYLDHVDAINEFFQTIGPSTCFMPGPCWYEPICSSGVISPILYTKRGVKS